MKSNVQNRHLKRPVKENRTHPKGYWLSSESKSRARRREELERNPYAHIRINHPPFGSLRPAATDLKGARGHDTPERAGANGPVIKQIEENKEKINEIVDSIEEILSERSSLDNYIYELARKEDSNGRNISHLWNLKIQEQLDFLESHLQEKLLQLSLNNKEEIEILETVTKWRDWENFDRISKEISQSDEFVDEIDENGTNILNMYTENNLLKIKNLSDQLIEWAKRGKISGTDRAREIAPKVIAKFKRLVKENSEADSDVASWRLAAVEIADILKRTRNEGGVAVKAQATLIDEMIKAMDKQKSRIDSLNQDIFFLREKFSKREAEQHSLIDDLRKDISSLKTELESRGELKELETRLTEKSSFKESLPSQELEEQFAPSSVGLQNGADCAMTKSRPLSSLSPLKSSATSGEEMGNAGTQDLKDMSATAFTDEAEEKKLHDEKNTDSETSQNSSTPGEKGYTTTSPDLSDNSIPFDETKDDDKDFEKDQVRKKLARKSNQAEKTKKDYFGFMKDIFLSKDDGDWDDENNAFDHLREKMGSGGVAKLRLDNLKLTVKNEIKAVEKRLQLVISAIIAYMEKASRRLAKLEREYAKENIPLPDFSGFAKNFLQNVTDLNFSVLYERRAEKINNEESSVEGWQHQISILGKHAIILLQGIAKLFKTFYLNKEKENCNYLLLGVDAQIRTPSGAVGPPTRQIPVNVELQTNRIGPKNEQLQESAARQIRNVSTTERGIESAIPTWYEFERRRAGSAAVARQPAGGVFSRELRNATGAGFSNMLKTFKDENEMTGSSDGKFGANQSHARKHSLAPTTPYIPHREQRRPPSKAIPLFPSFNRPGPIHDKNRRVFMF